MKIAITHTTRVDYDAEVVEAVMDVRLGPFSDADQRWERFDLCVDPAAGIRGYLMINTSPTLLGWAILAARAGRTVVDPQIRRVEPSAMPMLVLTTIS